MDELCVNGCVENCTCKYEPCINGCVGECDCKWKMLQFNNPKTGIVESVDRALIPIVVSAIPLDDFKSMVVYIIRNLARHNKSHVTVVRFLYAVFIRVYWEKKNSTAVIPLVAILCRNHFVLWRTFVFLAIRAVESPSVVESVSAVEPATAVVSKIPLEYVNVPKMTDLQMAHVVLFFLSQPCVVEIFGSLREVAPWSGVVKTTQEVYEGTFNMYKYNLTPRFKGLFPGRDDNIIKITILMILGYLLLPSNQGGSYLNAKYKMYNGRVKREAQHNRLILLRRVISIPPMPGDEWKPAMPLLDRNNHLDVFLRETRKLSNQKDVERNFDRLTNGYMISVTISPPNGRYLSTLANLLCKCSPTPSGPVCRDRPGGPILLLMEILSSMNLPGFNDVFLTLFRSEPALEGRSVIEYLYGILISDQNGSLTVKLSKTNTLQAPIRNVIGFTAEYLLRYTSVLRLYIYILRWMFISPKEKCILDKVKDLSKRRGGIQHIFTYTSMMILIKWRREEARTLRADGCAALKEALLVYSGDPKETLEELLREFQPTSAVVVAPEDASASASAIAPEDAVMVAPEDASTSAIAPEDAVMVAPEDAVMVAPEDAVVVAPDDASASAIAPEDAVVGDKRTAPNSEDEPSSKRGKQEQE
jgi:hypothetical protein